RPQPVGIQKSLMACSLLTLNWSAIPGSAGSPRWPWWPSCATASARFNTLKPPSPTCGGTSSVEWSKRRSAISKLASSCRTAASVSRGTAASAAHSWGCVSETSNLLSRNLFVVLERATLIGLTSLWINGRPLVPPKLNSKRASLVLSKIDEILAWEMSSDHERDTRFVELGRYLCEVRAGQYWRLDNLK